jgi:L-ribulose-5-phosphate 3-epimerase
MQRRDFLTTGAAGLVAAPALGQGSARFSKGICSVIFPRAMPIEERFRRARNAGFQGVEIRYGDEVHSDSKPDQVKRIGDAAHNAGVAIVSLWASEPFSANPLNSPDPEKRARGVESLRQAIQFATYLNCGAILLVPGRLGNGAKLLVGYEDTWKRMTAELRKAVPDAERAKVILTPENVWNKFLVSPLEMRAFVDQFHSPWLQTHFDIGNVMQFGYPQDWILTLGSRIKRVHVKDYKLSTRAEQGHFVDLLEGDVDWKEVMAALVKVGYRGFLSPEIDGGNDPDKLAKVSRALDKILSLA